MSKKVAIVQSNYIPWKGYFDLIQMVDEFILYDDMQYTKRDWRNRNLIKTRDGLKWLTIPVQTKGKYSQTIKDTKVCDHSWAKKHYRTLTHNYSTAKYFKDYQDIIKELYEKASSIEYLSEINFLFIKSVCDILKINTKISWSSDYIPLSDDKDKTGKLICICKSANANHYVSGPSAKSYMDENLFHAEGIDISYIDYSNYPEYPQCFDGFNHNVTILDLIFNQGPNATQYMRMEK